jgi:AcrR family transcriptional regulator
MRGKEEPSDPPEVRLGPGRPRSEKLDRKILDCAAEQLMLDGYAGMSIDAVAHRAGVSKATIYRRYADKADLVTAAIAAQPVLDIFPSGDSTRERLVNLLQRVRERMVDGGGTRILFQIVAESERNPALLEQHRERTVSMRRAEFARVLKDGIERGEVRGDIDTELTISALNGAWMADFVSGREFAPDWAESVVAVVWSGIEAPSAPR